MTAPIIELNDSEIRVARDSEIVLRTPGYAVLKPDSVVLGKEAVQLSHLNPRESSNRFWSNLNQDALPVRSPYARHNADLAYRQLLDIHEQAGKPDEFVFSVPGNYSPEQLSLLLGIVEACPFSAKGLVDTAVAAAAATAGPGEYIHLDMHLHHTVLTSLEVGDKVTRRDVQVIDDCGETDILDTSASFIADLFIQQSRFDPLHHAESEQSLYDQLPRCLSELSERNEVALEIQYDRNRHQARLLREPLLEALMKHYQRIINALDPAAVVLIGDRPGALPGFIDRVKGARLLEPGSVFAGVQSNRGIIQSEGDEISFITSLPVTATPVISADKPARRRSATAGPPAARVTHILINNQAYPLGGEAVYLSADGSIGSDRHADTNCSILLDGDRVSVRQEGDLSLYINGQRLNGQASVAAGDTLGFAGSDTTYRFIHVLPANA